MTCAGFATWIWGSLALLGAAGPVEQSGQPEFGRAEIRLGEQPAPPASAAVCGLVLVAHDTGPQVLVTQHPPTYTAGLREGEEVTLAVPVRGVTGPCVVTAEATLRESGGGGGDPVARRGPPVPQDPAAGHGATGGPRRSDGPGHRGPDEERGDARRGGGRVAQHSPPGRRPLVGCPPVGRVRAAGQRPAPRAARAAPAAGRRVDRVGLAHAGRHRHAARAVDLRSRHRTDAPPRRRTAGRSPGGRRGGFFRGRAVGAAPRAVEGILRRRRRGRAVAVGNTLATGPCAAPPHRARATRWRRSGRWLW